MDERGKNSELLVQNTKFELKKHKRVPQSNFKEELQNIYMEGDPCVN